MALSDLAVFSEYAYEAKTEVIRQQLALFNAASAGGMILTLGNDNAGDYSDTAFWAATAGLVRRRNAYGTGAVSEKVLGMLVDSMVKVAAGTPPIRLDPSEMKWIQQDPATRGAALGQQLAKQTLADYVNTAIMCLTSALLGQTANQYDGSAGIFTLASYNEGQRIYGESADGIVLWLQHSKVLFDIYGANLSNAAQLFTYGNIAIRQDPFGRPILVTDAPALLNAAPTPDIYYTLGLTPGAVEMQENNDYTANEETKNGNENIVRTFQAEWSYNVGVKGFTWDKTNGSKSPTDAALGTSTNWDKIATDKRDLAGVLIKSQ